MMTFEVLVICVVYTEGVELVGDIDHYTYQTFYSNNPWGWDIDIVNWSIAKIICGKSILY